jgi:hypothetical protein
MEFEKTAMAGRKGKSCILLYYNIPDNFRGNHHALLFYVLIFWDWVGVFEF